MPPGDVWCIFKSDAMMIPNNETIYGKISMEFVANKQLSFKRVPNLVAAKLAEIWLYL